MLGILNLQTHPLLSSRISCSAVSDSPPVDRKSLYEVLKIKRNASQTEIKTAYRTLAKLYHPDAASRFMNSAIVSTTDAGDFIEINKAYTTLSNPESRAVYDLNFRSRTKPRRFSISRSPRWETDQCW